MRNLLISFAAVSFAVACSTDASAQFYVYKGGEVVYSMPAGVADSISFTEPVTKTAKMMYLVGFSVGDGSWVNTSDAVGTSLIPMSIVSGAEYNDQGEGSLIFYGYFVAGNDGGFKIITTPGDWNDQWGVSGGFYAYRDGGSSNIQVSSDGYYSVKLNTQSTGADAIYILPMEMTPSVYTQICISGEFNSWTDTDMSPVSTASSMSGHNHLWKATVTAPTEGTQVKFKLVNDWSVNWGDSSFPYGVGVNNGTNIPIPEGTWLVIFNDIDGSYSFFAK